MVEYERTLYQVIYKYFITLLTWHKAKQTNVMYGITIRYFMAVKPMYPSPTKKDRQVTENRQLGNTLWLDGSSQIDVRHICIYDQYMTL